MAISSAKDKINSKKGNFNGQESRDNQIERIRIESNGKIDDSNGQNLSANQKCEIEDSEHKTGFWWINDKKKRIMDKNLRQVR